MMMQLMLGPERGFQIEGNLREDQDGTGVTRTDGLRSPGSTGGIKAETNEGSNMPLGRWPGGSYLEMLDHVIILLFFLYCSVDRCQIFCLLFLNV